jgi:hypothetical protein
MDIKMRQTKLTALPLLISAMLVSPTVFSAPASYADIIYSDRQRMMESHPYQKQVNAEDQSHKKPIEPLTWGTLIKSEHERLMQLYPESDPSPSQASPSKSRNSLPTSYNDIIQMERERMKH